MHRIEKHGRYHIDNCSLLCRKCHQGLHGQETKAHFAEVAAYNEAHIAALKQIEIDYRAQGHSFDDFEYWTEFQRNWDGWPEQP
jgi:hypothetical protein